MSNYNGFIKYCNNNKILLHLQQKEWARKFFKLPIKSGKSFLLKHLADYENKREK